MARLDDALARALPIAERLFAAIGTRTHDGVGITRATYGEGEGIAATAVAEEARRLGLEVAFDAAQNVYATLAGRDRSLPAVIVGSHLDSVPRGGNYDGLAGILGGLVCLAALKDAERALDRDIRVMAIRGEENAWFACQHIGAGAALGRFDIGALDKVRRPDSGRTLAEHMAEAGCDLAAVRAKTPYLGADRLRCYLELHIEQGPVLESKGIPVGLVTGIRGNFRCGQVRCVGTYGHAGAVPMTLRHDAVMAVAELVTETENLWRRIEDGGGDLVATFGRFFTDGTAHSVTTIPGEVRFSLDVRSHSAKTLAEVRAHVDRCCADIAARRGVRFEWDPVTAGPPVAMDEGLRRDLKACTDNLGIAALEMASGPGHDASVFVEAGVPSAMIFVRNQNGSHNPAEAMRLDDFAKGTRVLLAMLERVGAK